MICLRQRVVRADLEVLAVKANNAALGLVLHLCYSYISNNNKTQQGELTPWTLIAHSQWLF